MKIRNLFQKTICSLITIIYVSKDKTIKQEASKDLRDLVYQYDKLVYQYDKYVKHKNVYELGFKYSAADVSDFMYKCIESKDDIIWLSEDMFYGFEELLDTILEERSLHNS